MAKGGKNNYQKRSAYANVKPEMIRQLDHMLDFASPEEYRETLIEIYHAYIRREHESLPINFHRMAGQMSVMIEFWKAVDDELHKKKN
jgi:hypothetical protein